MVLSFDLPLDGLDLPLEEVLFEYSPLEVLREPLFELNLPLSKSELISATVT